MRRRHNKVEPMWLVLLQVGGYFVLGITVVALVCGYLFLVLKVMGIA